MTIMLVGTATADIPKEPVERPKFIEDMEDSEMAGVPSGMANLGNTCYLNATLQCLRTAPDLRKSLKLNGNTQSMGGMGGIDVNSFVVKGLSDVFQQLESNDAKGGATVSPGMLLYILYIS